MNSYYLVESYLPQRHYSEQIIPSKKHTLFKPMDEILPSAFMKRQSKIETVPRKIEESSSSKDSSSSSLD